MIYHKDHNLYPLNTMRLHSLATDYYEPENIEELTSLVAHLNSEGKNYHLLGGGSNIIMPPRVGIVIALGSICNDITIEGDYVEVGASVKIQQLIRATQTKNLGGIEYLFSLPCQVGGAVVMNAGRGKRHNGSIADFIESVTCLKTDSCKIVTLSKDQCGFAYRKSSLQKEGFIIVKIQLHLISRSASEIESLISDRMERQRIYLDASHSSCGSVFSKCNHRIMRLLRGFHYGGAAYSRKTSNWISNQGNATYNDILFLIRVAKTLHTITLQKCEKEIKVWKP